MRSGSLKLLFILILSILTLVQADEGMWLPHQVAMLNLKSQGLEIDPSNFFREDGTGLMNAVVYLGGATGEFVSKDGLILTNHHVAYGALQRASTVEHDYLANGFLAKSRNEEIQAPGMYADVLLGYQEVTQKIQAVLKPEMTPRQRYDAIDKIKKKLIAQVEKEGQDIRARVVAMYSGNQYYLFKFKRLKDIRIVYAPPHDLGNFGGEIDNWMWPRHTADFTFLRAYVSKDNLGLDYDPENVPYHPKSYLKISKKGVKEGDFTFVIGYPGRTYRNYSTIELEYDILRMQKRKDQFQKIIDFFEDAGNNNREIQIKYARKVRGLSNTVKNYQGKIDGFKKYKILEKKRAAENTFLNWVKRDKKKHQQYGDIINKLKKFYDKYKIHQDRTEALNSITNSYMGPALLSQAYLIYRTATERQKPDMEREDTYQERNLPFIKQRVKMAEKGYDLEVDKKFFVFVLKNLAEDPPENLPKTLKTLIQDTSVVLQKRVETFYQNTVLTNVDKRLELLEYSPEKLLKLNDPFLNLAAEIEEQLKSLREESKALAQERADLKKIYIRALLEFNSRKLAPDANSTIRLTFGTVKGYYPRDGVYYLPVTTLSGVLEKDTGEPPFRVPEKLKELAKNRDFGDYLDPDLNDIPTCFLNTTNVTGGNSGSPTLNAKGEQIGIIFDMTYESVIGDYYIIPELQRTISVDIRYVLFITEKFAGAKHIIKELEIN